MNIREAKKLRVGDKFRKASKNGHDNGYRVYAVSECSPHGFESIDQHGYHLHVQFDKQDSKAFLRECNLVTGKEPLTYKEILDRDVPNIVHYSKSLAREGICSSLRVYYRHEAIMAQATACKGDDDLDGWKDTCVEIPCNVEYSQYWGYLYQRLGRVPLFA